MGFWRRVCDWGRFSFGVGGMVVSRIVVVMGVGRLVFDSGRLLLVCEEGVWVRYSGPDPH